MKHKKIISCIFILLFCMTISGCSSLFLRKDALLADQNALSEITDIQDLTALGTGILQDVSTDGNQLLVFSTSKAPPKTYNIELYQHQKNEWTVINFVNSDIPIISGVFSSDGRGIFYTQTENTDPLQNEVTKLLWTSLDKTTTLTLSDDEESIVSSLCKMPDGKVLYANDHHQICMLNASGWRKNYTIDTDYNIDTLYYDAANEKIIFTGTYKDDPTTNLYLMHCNQNQSEPTLFDTDIVSCDLNPNTGNFIYIKKNASENQLILYNNSNGQTKKISSSDITNAVLKSDDSTVLYTVPLSTSDPQHQIIQVMSSNGKNIQQLTSPRIIASKLFFMGKKIYFSVMDEEADSDSDAYNFSIYVLTVKE